METILSIPSEMKYLESLLKLVQKKRDDNLKSTNLIKSNETPPICKICINKNKRNRTFHLLLIINNNLVEGLVAIRASMSIMSTIVVRELRIMHLVTSTESYKIVSKVVTQALGKINEIVVKVEVPK